MRCPACGHNNDVAATICSACGTGLPATPEVPTSATAATGDAASPIPSLPAGTRLLNDTYAVSMVLGQNDSAIIYRGGDLQARRYVAIKEFLPTGCTRRGNTVYPAGMMDPPEFETLKAQCIEEASKLSHIKHPGIARVEAVFEENNTAYTVMEYLEGKTLQQLIDEQGKLSESAAVAYIAKVGDALRTLHEANVIHANIKPANIIITGDSRVVLIGFNTPRAFALGESTGQETQTTSCYIPQEQGSEQSSDSPTTDVYTLGATLYYCLTGQQPSTATDRAAGKTLAAPHEINPAISSATSQAVMQAMQLNADQRPQSVAEFLQALPGATAVAAAVFSSATPSRPVTLAPQLGEQAYTPFSEEQTAASLKHPSESMSPMAPPAPIQPPYNQPGYGTPAADPAIHSGAGAATPVPPEVKGLNWGALFLTLFWSLAHNVWWGLLILLPVIGLIMPIILFFKGNEWAWKSRRWQSLQQFRDVQRTWGVWGVALTGCSLPVSIPLIAAILFPVFARGRENARRASCQSNLKQLSLAMMQYSQDYDEKFPLATVGGKGELVNKKPVGWADALLPYTHQTTLNHCPSDKTKEAAHTDPIQRGYTTYIYNSSMGDPAILKNKPTYELASDPAEVFMLYDGDGTSPQSNATYSESLGLDGLRRPNADENHFDGANHAYMDGHVKWLRGRG